MRGGVRSLTFTAQSAVVDGDELARRVETYLKEAVEKELADMVDSDFEAYKTGIITKKSEPDQRLTGQCERLWGEILQLPEADPVFDRQHREAEAVKKIKKSELQAFAREFLLPGGAKRRLLVSQITAQKRGKEFKEGTSTTSDVQYTAIEDEAAFRKAQDFV